MAEDIPRKSFQAKSSPGRTGYQIEQIIILQYYQSHALWGFQAKAAQAQNFHTSPSNTWKAMMAS